MLSLNLKELNIHTDFNDRMQKRLEATSSPNCSLYKTIFTSFKALLHTTQSPLN